MAECEQFIQSGTLLTCWTERFRRFESSCFRKTWLVSSVGQSTTLRTSVSGVRISHESQNWRLGRVGLLHRSWNPTDGNVSKVRILSLRNITWLSVIYEIYTQFYTQKCKIGCFLFNRPEGSINRWPVISHHRDARMAEVRKRNTKSETRDEVCIGYCHNNLIHFLLVSQKKTVTLHPNNYQFHSQLFEHLWKYLLSMTN